MCSPYSVSDGWDRGTFTLSHYTGDSVMLYVKRSNCLIPIVFKWFFASICAAVSVYPGITGTLTTIFSGTAVSIRYSRLSITVCSLPPV